MHDHEINQLNKLNEELFKKLRSISKKETTSTADSLQTTLNNWAKEIAKTINLPGDPPEFKVKLNTEDKKAKPVTITPINAAAANVLDIIRKCGLTDVL
jgi:hypothetical protein